MTKSRVTLKIDHQIFPARTSSAQREDQYATDLSLTAIGDNLLESLDKAIRILTLERDQEAQTMAYEAKSRGRNRLDPEDEDEDDDA